MMDGDQQKGLSEEWTKERHRRKRTREGSVLWLMRKIARKFGNMPTNGAAMQMRDLTASRISCLPSYKYYQFTTYKRKLKDLEQKNKSTHVEDLQVEVKNLNSKMRATTLKLTKVASQQEATLCALQWSQQRLPELQQRHTKLECHIRSGNLKNFGIREDAQQSRNFMITLR